MQTVLSCFSILWVSNVEMFNGKIRFSITGGTIMSIVGIVNEIIAGAGSCRIGHP